jgi:predicted NBD/HSP70 family sugar kinase
MEQTLGFAGIRQRLQDIEHPAIRDAMAEDSLELIILGLATQGDKQVCKVLSETWYKLGLVYGSLANLLDPGAIVLDPHFGQADADSCAALRRGIMEHLVGPHADQIEIIVSQLGAEAAPLGAALALLDDLILNGTVTRIISQRGTGSP